MAVWHLIEHAHHIGGRGEESVRLERDADAELFGPLTDLTQQVRHRRDDLRRAFPSVRLATEEVVTNVIEHGYEGMPAGPITVRFRREPSRVVITVEDLARPFDPALVPHADTVVPIEQRRTGA